MDNIVLVITLLLVIDAQNFTSEPVARVLMPQRVPYGFHATWISSLAASK